MIEIHPGDYLRETTIRKVNISAMNEDGEIEYTEVEKEVYNYYLVLDVKIRFKINILNPADGIAVPRLL